MEPWQQEELRQLHRRRTFLCQCCGRPVETEQYLDLEPFGVRAVGCERCVYEHLQFLDR